MSKPWFAPKRYGYGASLPISWEGWTVLTGFFAGMAALAVLPERFLPAPDAALVRFIGIVALIAGLVAIARVRTEGGWRWRNGKN